MKKMIGIAILAAMFSTSALAEIKIGGNNTQKVNVQGAILNVAVGSGDAKQNIASNKGSVSIKGNNIQDVNVQGAILNVAVGAGKAEQNIASNDATGK